MGPDIRVVRFERLYADHRDDVVAYCLRRTGRDEAFDAAAEVFLVAWRRIDDVPRDERTLPWLYVVAARVLANTWRKAKREARALARLERSDGRRSPEPETQVVRRADEERVVAAVNRLRTADRELLRLTTWEELPRPQIAQILGCSVHAVEQRRHRALGRLARELQRDEGALRRRVWVRSRQGGAA